MHDVVREVMTAALAPRQMDVVAAHQISGAPCDKKARQQTAQAENATAVLCFHSMAQGQDTVVGLALYNASNDRVIRSVVLPVAGAHAADLVDPLQAAAKELLSEATSTTPQEPKPSIVSKPSESDRGKPRPWVAFRVTGWLFLGSGIASLVPGLVIGGLSEFQDAPKWVPSVFVGGACTLLGAALLSRSAAQKRVSQGVALVPLRGGAALSWSHSF
ncbi:MAG: hypothetical protein MUC50_01065 [Myxococcota bacterium]|nr:hypothetical protein [Myxococcota bacterium]